MNAKEIDYYDTLQQVADELKNQYRTAYQSKTLHVSIEFKTADRLGNRYRTDLFYDPDNTCYELWSDQQHKRIFSITGDADIDSQMLEETIRGMTREYEKVIK